MQAEPLITWSEPIKEYVGFIAQFLAVGAVGFRFAALRDRLDAPAAPAVGDTGGDTGGHAEGQVYAHAARRAATLGLLGAVIVLVMSWDALPSAASRVHLTVGGALTQNFQIGAPAWLLVIAVIGLALAAAGQRTGWWLALLGVVVGPLSGIFAGQWLKLVNPVHRLVALVHAVRLYAHREALSGRERLRARRLELATPAPDARERRWCDRDPSHVEGRAEHGGPRAGGDGDPREPAIATAAASSRRRGAQ